MKLSDLKVGDHIWAIEGCVNPSESGIECVVDSIDDEGFLIASSVDEPNNERVRMDLSLAYVCDEGFEDDCWCIFFTKEAAISWIDEIIETFNNVKKDIE